MLFIRLKILDSCTEMAKYRTFNDMYYSNFSLRAAIAFFYPNKIGIFLHLQTKLKKDMID